jgi:hypothetical protein
MVQPLWKAEWWVLRELNTDSQQDPVILFLSLSPRELEAGRALQRQETKDGATKCPQVDGLNDGRMDGWDGWKARWEDGLIGG